jgi:hypothetical protein
VLKNNIEKRKGVQTQGMHSFSFYESER